MDFSNESRNLQIANYLQTLRLEQNLTLEQLSDVSHIPIAHLASIEEGRFNRFDDFYLKMYLKKYTQTLGVNLEQLYAYARQQPIEDLPKEKKENPAETVTNPDSMQHQVQPSQPTSIETPSRQKPQVKRSTPTVSPFGSTHTKPKVNIGKILICLFLVALIGLLLFFMVDFFRNIGNREEAPEDPPAIENPHDIDLDPDGDEDDEADDGEVEETELESESEPEDETTVDLDEHIGNTHHFSVVTLHDEIELRIEHHSGPNWIGGILNGTQFINATYYEGDTLEESFVVENGSVFRLTTGAIQFVETIFINGVEVNFYDGLVGPENFEFTITIQSE